TYRWVPENVVAGAAFFVMGLLKKVVLADGIQPYVGPVFDGNQSLGLVVAWGGALAYTLQLYFDFSGYSDMAIGLSKIFNVNLPLNFNSPYKAHNISDFWRRWHMTLSRFLRDYLYIRLGGNRHGPSRRYIYLMVTMLLGGLWHGAGWTFVIWGGLHGCYLVLNHGWIAFKIRSLSFVLAHVPAVIGALFARTLTLLAVVVAWVFFRAHDVDDALRVLSGMAGLNGAGISPLSSASWWQDQGMLRQAVCTVLLMCIAVFSPNSQQLVAWFVQRADGHGWAQRDGARWFVLGVLLWVMTLTMLINGSRGASEFIYFNF
ncbi:MAG: MBOAT family protein, partial [Caldilineaceae bacterium]|nr:MBOAT family protein [Caldilineaceae bacterium]